MTVAEQLGMPPMLARMYRIIASTGDVGIDREAIHERLYGDRDDGGPDIGVIAVMMTKLRKILATSNLRLAYRDEFCVYKITNKC